MNNEKYTGRNIKVGLDYFIMDLNFLSDIKIRKLIRGCGASSVSVILSLLTSVYRDDGYYIKWDDNICFLIADEMNIKESFVEEVVQRSLQVELFNLELYKRYKILTSRGIQKRYFEATKRRKEVLVKTEYKLIDLSEFSNIKYEKDENANINIKDVNINSKDVNINEINVYRNKQRKEKKRKEKKSKVMCENKVSHDIFSEEVTSIASSMLEIMRRLKPDMKEPSLTRWHKDIDYMLRLDKRTKDEIISLFIWTQSNSFWMSNIRSPGKLREKWDTLDLQKNKTQYKRRINKATVVEGKAVDDVGVKYLEL